MIFWEKRLHYKWPREFYFEICNVVIYINIACITCYECHFNSLTWAWTTQNVNHLESSSCCFFTFKVTRSSKCFQYCIVLFYCKGTTDSLCVFISDSTYCEANTSWELLRYQWLNRAFYFEFYQWLFFLSLKKIVKSLRWYSWSNFSGLKWIKWKEYVLLKILLFILLLSFP